MLFGSVIGGPMLYKMPISSSSKKFVTRVFWRLRNHTFDGHISGLEQDRDNLKPLLPTKSPMPYRLLTLPSRSREHTTSGLAFLASRSHTNRRKRILAWFELTNHYYTITPLQQKLRLIADFSLRVYVVLWCENNHAR